MYQYSYQKTSAINAEQILRFCINFKIHRDLNLENIPSLSIDESVIKKYSQHAAVAQMSVRLSTLMHSPELNFNLRDFHWLISYGTEAMVIYFQRNITHLSSGNWKSDLFLNLTQKITSEGFLKADYLTPDITMTC